MGVEDAEPRGPDELADVREVGDDRVGQARPQWYCLHRDHGAALQVGLERDRGSDGRQEHEGRLLQAEPERGAASQAAQRPEVEEQENHRQRHRHGLGEERQRGPRHHRGVPRGTPPAREAAVGQQGQHPEEGAEHVLALRHPGHRLHVQRVDGEERGHQGARPQAAREEGQGQEEQRDVGRVQRHARRVMARGVEAEELDVEHVRHPGERVPVGRLHRGEGPGHRLGAQPACTCGLAKTYSSSS